MTCYVNCDILDLTNHIIIPFRHLRGEGGADVIAKSKCTLIVDDILSKIVNRVYVAGDRLPTESELCEAYGVSRVTIRESLKKLDMMDVISIEQGRGTFVKKASLGNFMQPMFNLIDFGSFDIRTIYDARLYIETGSCRLAALNRGEDDIRALEALIRRMRQTRGADGAYSMPSIQEIDKQFHIRIATASNNEIIKAAVVNLETISAACAERIHESHAVMESAVEDHQRIFDAIVARDPDAAERAIVAHTLASKAFLS